MGISAAVTDAIACAVAIGGLVAMSDDRAWAAVGGLATLILLGYVLSRSVGPARLHGGHGRVVGAARPRVGGRGRLVFVAGAVLATRHYPVRRGSADSAPGGTALRAGPAVG